MIWIALALLCAGSLVHNEMYFRGRYGVRLVVAERFYRIFHKVNNETDFSLLVTYILLAPVGCLYLIMASLVREDRPYYAHRRHIKIGWRRPRAEERQWRYRVQFGPRSRERLNRMKQRRQQQSVEGV
jgi:hypothetical protein